LHLNCAGINMVARVSPRAHTKIGDNIKIVFNTNKIHLFDKETEKVITN